MTYTLFDLTLRTARELGIVKEGLATGGSTVTVVDTNGRKEADDYWVGVGDDTATVWVTYDAGGAGAAPQGEYGVVSDSAAAGTITVRTAFTAAPAAGDRYAIAKRRYPLYLLIEAVNRALQDIGSLPVVNTSLTTTSSIHEYTLPVAASEDLRQVWVQTNDDADDNNWQLRYDAVVKVGSAGSAGTLIFNAPLPDDRTIKLIYMGAHAELRVASDKVFEILPVERIVYPAALYCLQWYRAKTRSNNAALVDTINIYQAKVDQVKQGVRIGKPARIGHLMIVGSGDCQLENEPNKVYL